MPDQQQPQMEIRCIRFQYQKGVKDPPPFETLPFYLVQIRSFLRHNHGHAMWLKGNAGGERAAWLFFDATVSCKVEKLLTEPLNAGGYFAVTATLQDAKEIIDRYMFRKEMEVVGQLQLPELSLGSKEPPKVAGAPWWVNFDWDQGFWYPDLKLGGKQTYHHIRAKEGVTKTHEDPKGLMLLLDGYEEIAISYRGRDEPQIYCTPSEPTENSSVWFWETHLQRIIAEKVPLQKVLEAEPAWQQFQDTVKLPE